LRCIFEPTVFADDLPGIIKFCHALALFIPEKIKKKNGLGFIGSLEGMDQGQSHFALYEIIADILAG
jgi:hypothetical protein